MRPRVELPAFLAGIPSADGPSLVIILRYIYADGFTNQVNLVELFDRGFLLVEHFARLHGGISAIEVPPERRMSDVDACGQWRVACPDSVAVLAAMGAADRTPPKRS